MGVGARHGYHHFCLGLYQSEIIRRVDPQQRSIGRFFQEEIAEPLDLEFYIGLPPQVPDSRPAIVDSTRPIDMLRHLREIPVRFTLAMLLPTTMTARTMSNPPILRGKATDFSRRDALTVEMPSANGIGQVRSIAKLYGVFATGGTELGIKQERSTSWPRPRSTPPPDHATGSSWATRPTRWASGNPPPRSSSEATAGPLASVGLATPSPTPTRTRRSATRTR